MDPNPTPTDPSDENTFDLFSYPHLYPSGWDLSPAEPEAKPQDERMPGYAESFLRSRNFPSGWDLS